MQTVAVVGAGLVGASLAFRLAQAGAKVILVERTDPAAGTTGASFAWTNANQKTPRPYFELNYAGMREHLRLREEFGAAPWLHQDGNLIWSSDSADLESRVNRLQDWGYTAEWRSASDVNELLEPDLLLPDPALPLAFFPEESWVDAPRLVQALIARARALGAETHFGQPVISAELVGGQLISITLSGRRRIAVDAIVNAAGPSAGDIAALLGRTLPMVPTSGLLVRLRVAAPAIRRVVHTPLVNIRPDSNGFILLHHDSIDRQLGDRTAIETDDPLVTELVERGRSVLSGLHRASPADARIGVRPYPRDGLSCAGAVSGINGYYEAVTHSGVTLGPLLGRLLAHEIVHGAVDPQLAPFRPDRF